MTDGQGVNNKFRLLLLTPTGRDAAMTVSVLQRAGVVAHACTNLGDVCKSLRDGAGALLIGEEAVPTEPENCLNEFLSAQPAWSDLPILVLVRPGADSIAVATAMERLGNVTVLERPTRVAALVSAVRTAMRARQRQYQLRDEEEQLRQAHDLLEARVGERTAELQAVNEVLQSEVRVREAAEERAHELLRQLVAAQETERARIARDIHDELGQQMTSLRLHLSEVSQKLGQAETPDPQFANLENLANTIDEHISFLAWKIRPSNLESIGLMEAVRRYINEWSRNFSVAAEFVPLPLRPPALMPEIEINLYRIVQEALNNIAKYAKATDVAVLLSVNGREVNLVIEDNGVGFDLSSPPTQKNGFRGQGLKGMQERAQLLGGSFEIESDTGKGTKIYTKIPARFATQEATQSANFKTQ